MLLDDIYDYLTNAYVVGGAWPCYKAYMPDETVQCVGIFETGGFPADTLLRENEPVTFQVRVRGNRLDYETVRRKWQDLFNLLQDSTPASGYAFVQAAHYGPLAFTDPSGRVNMTMNFRVLKSRTV